jgi:hypothetical protein
MAESDSDPKRPTPDLSVAAGGLPTASKALQVFVEELARITQQNFEQTTQIMEDLKSARDIGDLLAIQTKFVQETFETFSERLHRMSALMADLPTEFTQIGKDVAYAGAKVAQDAASVVSKPGSPEC